MISCGRGGLCRCRAEDHQLPHLGRTQYPMIEDCQRGRAAPEDEGFKKPLKIAIMLGCVVNGPGEASDADIGIAQAARTRPCSSSAVRRSVC